MLLFVKDFNKEEQFVGFNVCAFASLQGQFAASFFCVCVPITYSNTVEVSFACKEETASVRIFLLYNSNLTPDFETC